MFWPWHWPLVHSNADHGVLCGKSDFADAFDIRLNSQTGRSEVHHGHIDIQMIPISARGKELGLYCHCGSATVWVNLLEGPAEALREKSSSTSFNSLK